MYSQFHPFTQTRSCGASGTITSVGITVIEIHLVSLWGISTMQEEDGVARKAQRLWLDWRALFIRHSKRRDWYLPLWMALINSSDQSRLIDLQQHSQLLCASLLRRLPLGSSSLLLRKWSRYSSWRHMQRLLTSRIPKRSSSWLWSLLARHLSHPKTETWFSQGLR